MIYPLLRKRILKRIRDSYENLLLTAFNDRLYPKYEKWLTEYFDLNDDDRVNILTKFERAQTAGIIYAMRRKDREIFVNQFGCFYIKQTTTDFYNALERMIGDKSSDEYNYEEVKNSALEECRALYIKRAIAKKNPNGIKEVIFK